MYFRSITGNTLAGKLTIYIVLLALFITLASTAMLLFLSYQNSMKSLYANFALIEESYLDSLVENLWVYNDKQLDIQLDGLVGLPGVENVHIKSDGKISWSSGTVTSDKTLEKKIELTYQEGTRRESLGILHVIIGLDQAYQELYAGIRVALLTSAVVVFFTAGFILLLFRVLVARHMKTVANFLNSIEMENAEVELSLNRPPRADDQEDELDKVVTAINNMRRKLQQSIAKIRHNEKHLEVKNKELEQIIYAISHDLRSPLVNIDGYSKELERSFKAIHSALESDQTPIEALETITPLFGHELPDALRFIRASSIKMDSLLAGLLKLARAGRTTLTIDSLDMNSLMVKVIEINKYQIKEAGVEIELGDLPPCQGDAVQVNQVFSNLLANALKYLDPKRPGVIWIDGKVKGEYVVYCVEDNGVGIAPMHQQNIFEIFHQLDPKNSEGEGLGLNIVQQILGRLFGSIRVESELDVGSRFYVELPIVVESDTDGGNRYEKG